MSVYVDNMRAGYGRMTMCHMIADHTEELLEMVDRIGVQKKWIQNQGTPKEHFDVCLSKRQKAISLGAIEVTQMELARKITARRNSTTPHPKTSQGDK